MLRKINNSKVIPVRIPHVDKSKIKGTDMFSELHSNIFRILLQGFIETMEIWQIGCRNLSLPGKTQKYLWDKDISVFSFTGEIKSGFADK
jgi:hypothetical protein